MEDKRRELSIILSQRGIDTDEVESICDLVSYLYSVDNIAEKLIDIDLPLAFGPVVRLTKEAKL